MYRRHILSTSVLAMSLVAASQCAGASGHDRIFALRPRVHLPIRSGPMNEVYSGRIMVKVNGADHQDGASARLTAEQTSRISYELQGARLIGGMAHGGWTEWEIPVVQKVHAAMRVLAQDPDVIVTEPVNKVYALDLPIPNDADLNYVETGSQYVFNFGSGGGFGGSSSGSIGSIISSIYGGHGSGGSADFLRLWNLRDVNAITGEANNALQGAWALYPGKWYTKANKPTDCPIIAFVDSGIDPNHPDFINAGGTGQDVSEGGQIINAESQYFNAGALVPGGSIMDAYGHGTHVAGIAIAAGNNGSYMGDGIIGIGYNSRGMILRVFDDQGNSDDTTAAAAIEYAADHGAAIINCSIGTTNYSQVFQDAVTYATQKGSLVVAGGNENGSGGGNLGPIYPAGCSGALGVTANGPNGISADDYYAGYGNYVGMAAPGGDVVILGQLSYKIQYVFSTTPGYPTELTQDPAADPPVTEYYSYLAGTSMATPHVSGAAGLFYGQQGMHQTDGFANLKAFQTLQMTALGTGGAPDGGWEQTQGYGSLDLQGLLTAGTNPNPRGATVGDVTGIVYYGGTPLANVRITATLVASPHSTYQTTSLSDGTYRLDPLPAGIYNVTADPFGAPKTKEIQVTAGCDMPAVDFFCGPKIAESAGPTVAKFNILSLSPTTLSVDQWAYDTTSEIDLATVEIGTLPKGDNILAPKTIIPGKTAQTLTGLKLPAAYNATFTYTNGVGNVSHGYVNVAPEAKDAYVLDATPLKTYNTTTLDVQSGPHGSNEIIYVGFSIIGLSPNLTSAKLTLTGKANGGPISIGAYNTELPWVEDQLNWLNKPVIQGNVVSVETVSSEQSYTWDITSIVQAAKKSGKISVTIALKCQANSVTGASFYSHRSATNQPSVALATYD